MDNTTALLWEVSYNSKYGQPSPPAYKLDTIIVNRRTEEAIERGGGALGDVIKLGSLRDICWELGNSEGGESVQSVKRALLQNASTFINAKIACKTKGYKIGSVGQLERSLEAAFSRYSIIFTGEGLPDGRMGGGNHADAFVCFLAQEETECEELQRIGLSLKKFDTQGQRPVRFRQFFTSAASCTPISGWPTLTRHIGRF